MQVLCEITHYYIFYRQLSPPLCCEQERVFTNKQYHLGCSILAITIANKPTQCVHSQLTCKILWLNLIIFYKIKQMWPEDKSCLFFQTKYFWKNICIRNDKMDLETNAYEICIGSAIIRINDRCLLYSD